MLLQIGNADSISDPSREDLEQVLRSLGEEEYSPFVILSATPDNESYMQAFVLEVGRCNVEFRDGRSGKQYAVEGVDEEAAASLLAAYQSGDARWRNTVRWKRILEKRATKKSGPSRRIPKSVQREVWRRDCGRCVECGSKTNIEFDHVIPFSRGGSNTARNIQLLCEECNRKKSDRDPGSH